MPPASTSISIVEQESCQFNLLISKEQTTGRSQNMDRRARPPRVSPHNALTPVLRESQRSPKRRRYSARVRNDTDLEDGHGFDEAQPDALVLSNAIFLLPRALPNSTRASS